jgi:monoamine oxidase
MKIAIVGGGLAGIAAAHALLAQNGQVEVHLLEATGRYGGRALTDNTSIPGFAFDKGAQYIQDPGINPLTDLARELGFVTIEENARYMLRVEKDGIWQDLPTTTPDVQAVVSRIQKSYDQASMQPNVIVAPKPRLDTQAEWFGQATSPYGPFTESAESWQYIAADRAREAEGDGRENLFVAKGIGALVSAYGDRLAMLYPRAYTAHMGAKVSRIVYDDRQATLHFAGKSLSAAACIVTAPVSILADGIAFEPVLPPHHKAALKVLRLGSYKKLALRLRVAPDAIVPGVNYYLQQDEPAGVWQYYRLPHAPDVLVAHAAGDFAAALDQLPDTEVFRLFKTRVQEACDGVYFTTGKAITNWSAQPETRGAYSYSAFNGGAADDPAALAARVELGKPVKRLFLAGEATHIDYYGTLQGAFFEGCRAAEEILAGIEA